MHLQVTSTDYLLLKHSVKPVLGEWLPSLGPINRREKVVLARCRIHLEALITVHVHKGLYLGNRFIDIAQIWKECCQDICDHMPINIIAKYFILKDLPTFEMQF